MVKIVVKDRMHPEDEAMLQAMYSRSPKSVDEHIKKVEEVGSGNFMDQYYVGYNHASIGDCGTTTVYIEDVSMLAAKAFQDWPLYSGQEASTRYIDFSKQRIEDPIGSERSRDIIDRWMSFYLDAGDRLREHLKEKYPIREGEGAVIYERAIKARSFDILRGFLPAGATTNLSWHTNLRQAADKLLWLMHHPDNRIAALAGRVYDALREKYVHSFTHRVSPQVDLWRYDTMSDQQYTDYRDQGNSLDFTSFGWHHLSEYKDVLRTRPKRAELPPFVADAGLIRSKFIIDFGSFRDVQRHRNGVVRMPLLTVNHGFHNWYLNELPDDLREQANQLIDKQVREIGRLSTDPLTQQYYVAMGFNVICRVTQALPAFVYRVELRSQKTVHPTLRRIAQREAEDLARQMGLHGIDMPLYVDLDPDDWDVRRGKQTITEKT